MSFINPIHNTPFAATNYNSLGNAFAPPFLSRTRRRVPQPPASRGKPNGHPTITFDLLGQSRQGIPMRDIQPGFRTVDRWLAKANDQVFAGSGLKRITLYITWPGFEHIDWNRSIDLVGGSITRAELANVISQNFARFVEKAQYQPSSVSDWPLGPNAIRFEHLVLVSIYNIHADAYQVDVAVDPYA
ncbi:hypothetical protein VKT23_011759 [Stygiomarasmius scandens]|uniref:Uncharacterized protein n=1 Tax=Marasmiellus scandens TaxID=2682957 RepID=A0ABR1JD08_9AGAR